MTENFYVCTYFYCSPNFLIDTEQTELVLMEKLFLANNFLCLDFFSSHLSERDCNCCL